MSIRLKISLILIIGLFSSLYLNSQNFDALPKIVNYYNLDNPYTTEQIWDIKQAPDGLMYFAANSYFLEFDGVNYKSLFNTLNSSFLSFAIDSSNRRFYIGNKNNLSIAYVKNGTFIKEDLDIPISINYCWKTYYIDNNVYYFVNKSDVIVLRDNQIELVQRPSNFEIERGFYANNKLYAVSKSGIAEIKGNKLDLLSFDKDDFYKEDIRVMLDYNDKYILTATKANNIYLLSKDYSTIERFKTDADKYLEKSQIYNGTKLNDTTFVITTLSKGVFIITASGKLLGHYDQDNGLESNAIYTALVDKYKNIWLGTGKGVSLIFWGNSVKYVDKRMGLNSGITGFNFFKEKALISTYDGLFFTDKQSDKWHTFLKPTNPPILYASQIVVPKTDSNYAIVAGYGQYQILDKNLNIVNTELLHFDPKSVVESPVVNNRFFWGSKQSFRAYILKHVNGKPVLEKEKEFFDFAFNIDNLFFDRNNNLWVSHSNFLFFLDFDDQESLSDYEEEYFYHKHGLPDCPILSLFEIHDTLYVSTFEGLYFLSNSESKPENYEFKQKKLDFIGNEANENIFSFKETEFHYYFLCKTSIYRVSKDFKEYKKLNLRTNFEPYYSSIIVKDSILWLNSKDKIVSIDTNCFNNNSTFKNKVILRSIRINGEEEYNIYVSDSLIDIVNNEYFIKNSLKNKNSSITLRFFVDYFDNSELLSFSYFIEGRSEKWETFSGNELLLNHLQPGKYKIWVKATNYNTNETEPVLIRFNVKRKLYATVYAFILYIVLFFLVVYSFVSFFNKRIRNEKKNLEDIVRKRTALLEEQKEELAMQSKELIEQKKILERETNRLQIALVELKQLSLVAQKTNNSVLIVEQNGKFEWWNRGFTDLFGYKINKYRDLPLKEAQKKIRPDILKEIKAYSLDKGTISYTSHEVFDNGEEIWYQTIINPVMLENQEFVKFVVIDYNITPIKNSEKEIQKQKEITQQTKNRTNKVISELKVKKEEYSNVSYFDKKNLEYSKLLRKELVEDNYSSIDFFKNYFVLDMPQRDLSGDFVWSQRINDNEQLVFIGDSTGHKIRGTVNSVITLVELYSLYTRNPKTPINEALKILDERLFDTFNHLETIKARDHLNLAILKFKIKERELEFASSRIPMYLIRQKDDYAFFKYEADRINVGTKTDKEFNIQTIKLEKNDRIYVASDGWVNQFGKFGIKKYSSVKIRDFLLSIQSFAIHEQSDMIKSEIKMWRGSFEQTDDIIIFGAEI